MSIKQISKNKYKIEVVVGYNNNKKIREYETFNGTKKEAELRESEIKLQVKNNTYISKNKITLYMFIQEWLESKKSTLAIKTYKNYELYCKNICKCIGHIKLNNLSPKILDSFYNELKTKTNYSDRTIKDHYTSVTTILNTAVKWGYLNFNPNLRTTPIKCRKKEISCFTPEEANYLLHVLKSEPLKNQVLINLALDSGCRKGEITGLTWEDINFDTGCITINKATQYVPGYGIFEKETKTETSNRIVYISKTTLNLLKQYKKQQLEKRLKLGDKWQNSKRIFTTDYGADMHPNTPYKMLQSIIKKYNLKKIPFHGLRHTNASLLKYNKVPLQTISKRLGHSSIGVTNKVYMHFYEDEMQDVALVTENILNVK